MWGRSSESEAPSLKRFHHSSLFIIQNRPLLGFAFHDDAGKM
ncbi:hypothetical protein D1AOALGA4SA_890 [Olavius algarvensis Delta 1 endosymbiont]|nr:hypothetical protein D1AOALGA4SA_890 [Olavius algarvensis Delta 1 endosymbiont]